MQYIKNIPLPKVRYNPITKETEIVKPRKKKERNKPKHRRNLIGCYPGYIFTINGQEYKCVDATDLERPSMPIPVRIWRTPEVGKVFLKPHERKEYF